MNWIDRFRRPPEPSRPAVGLGMLVQVESPPGSADVWEGEPIGVVIQGGINEIYGYPGLLAPRFWVIAFDTLVYMEDGRGPFEQAVVPEWRLRVLDPDA
ncbi:MAG TPA: hypothetical protein VGC45_07610 [Gryllotalpicola sp.]